VPYGDWPEEFQDIWDEMDQTVGFENFTAGQLEYAEFMFEEGFMHYADEASFEDTSFAREEFFAMIGEEWEDYFDWEAWREAMGYE
jgi:hypothetical protein